MAHWFDDATEDHPYRVAFADGNEAFTTEKHAADLLDFIDREKGIQDLRAGLTFRTSMGSTIVRALVWTSAGWTPNG